MCKEAQAFARRNRERLDMLKSKSRWFHLTRQWYTAKERVGNVARKVGWSGNGGPSVLV